jgi:hypothetical protein
VQNSKVFQLRRFGGEGRERRQLVQLIVTVVSAGAAVAGVAFGVWRHFVSRKTSELRYEISQLADYKVPAQFLKSLSRAPITISIESTGTKAAENTKLAVKTRFPIDECEVQPAELKPTVFTNEVHLDAGRLNPGQSVRVFIACNGDPALDQLENSEITHAEGAALSKAQRSKESRPEVQIQIFVMLTALMTALIVVLLVAILAGFPTKL